MAGVALVNPALRVEVVGVTRWQGSPLAVLITPWCMSLIWLPAEEADRRAAQDRVFHRFPSGVFAFLWGSEPEIGEYHSCALFSPMAQFADQESARAAAEAALAALFLPAAGARVERTGDKPVNQRLSRRGFLFGGRSRG